MLFMKDACSSISLFHKEYVWEIAPDVQFAVVEKNKGGAGNCFFMSSSGALFIKSKDGKPTVWAVKNAKCAEASFLTTDASGTGHLHIVEMKSKLTKDEFQKVIDQWRGMLLASLAILGISDKPRPAKVTVYIAYNSEEITAKDPAQLVTYKVKVGGDPQAGIKEWKQEKVALFSDVTATIVKGQRTAGDVNFGTV